MSTKQEDVFFGDLVDRCCLIYLTAGDTFMIPSGSYQFIVYTISCKLQSAKVRFDSGRMGCSNFVLS